MHDLDLPALSYDEALTVLGAERHNLTRETRRLEQGARRIEEEIGRFLECEPALRDPVPLLVLLGQVQAALASVHGAWEGLCEGVASLNITVDGYLEPGPERRELRWERLTQQI